MTFPYPKCDPGTKLRVNKRYFGEFKCRSCARWWMSGNLWLGSGQDCTGCGELTFPWKLSYLQLPSTAEGEIEKAHPQRDCERCRKLGYYCRNSEDVNVQFNRQQRINDTVLASSQSRSYSPSSSSSRSSNYNAYYPPLGGNSVNATANSYNDSSDDSRDDYENSTRTLQSSATNLGTTNFNSDYYYNRSNNDFFDSILSKFFMLFIIALFIYGIYYYLQSRQF